MTGMLGKY
jgi:hypothetical protein